MAGYGMGGYVGNTHDKARITRQEKEREEAKQKFEEAKRKAEEGAGLRKFGAGTTETLETAFKNETVGLFTRQEFVEKRATIGDRLQEEKKRQRAAEEEAEWQEKERQKAVKAKKEQKHKLSFAEDEEEPEGSDGGRDGVSGHAPSTSAANDSNGTPGVAAAPAQGPTRRRFATLGKDPTVRSDFLPDKDRDREEQELREQLKQEWEEKQEAIRAEPLDITYSYYNGTGHRRSVTVKKGSTIGQFLKAVHEQLAQEFREMRTTSVSNLMYVKEDIILPHTTSFYDLILNKVRGKSGPLFQFDLVEHAVAAFDPRVKSQDSHAGKVVDRHWYTKNKHIFPASRWEVFDLDKLTQERDT
ncbi:XAP5 [Auxenochlorella protothecoides x Auxenochlorella symbiontica]